MTRTATDAPTLADRVAVGQQWHDPNVTWLPTGHRSVVTITGVYRVVAGVSCSVARREVDVDGVTVDSAHVGEGAIFARRLVDEFKLIESL